LGKRLRPPIIFLTKLKPSTGEDCNLFWACPIVRGDLGAAIWEEKKKGYVLRTPFFHTMDQ